MLVQDAVDGKPIIHARILVDNEIFYTNDDGKVPLPENAVNIEVFAGNYDKVILKSFSALVKLKPRIRSIKEVQIRNYNNIASLIKSVYKSMESFIIPNLLFITLYTNKKYKKRGNKYAVSRKYGFVDTR